MKYVKMIHDGFSLELQTQFISLETIIIGTNIGKFKVAIYKSINSFNSIKEERFVHYILTINFVNETVQIDRKEGFE